jgi:hypothetical protein
MLTEEVEPQELIARASPGGFDGPVVELQPFFGLCCT